MPQAHSPNTFFHHLLLRELLDVLNIDLVASDVISSVYTAM
jgi:hypothetical protein